MSWSFPSFTKQTKTRPAHLLCYKTLHTSWIYFYISLGLRTRTAYTYKYLFHMRDCYGTDGNTRITRMPRKIKEVLKLITNPFLNILSPQKRFYFLQIIPGKLNFTDCRTCTCTCITCKATKCCQTLKTTLS